MKKFFSQGKHWPLFIIGLVVLNFGAGIFLVVLSSSGTHAVEPDYYRKAITWDKTMAQDRTNKALGWQVELSFEKPIITRSTNRIPKTTVVLKPKTKLGLPIKGATINVEAFSRLRAQWRKKLTFKERPDGSYAIPIKLWPTGLWRFLVTVQQGKQRFTATLEQDVPRLF
jgi:nitrogen fixation protein FixH